MTSIIDPLIQARPLEDLETSVLFDIAAEAATALSGTYLWLERRALTAQDVDRWRSERRAVQARRRALLPDDRAGVAMAIEEWAEQRRHLKAVYQQG